MIFAQPALACRLSSKVKPADPEPPHKDEGNMKFDDLNQAKIGIVRAPPRRESSQSQQEIVQQSQGSARQVIFRSQEMVGRK